MRSVYWRLPAIILLIGLLAYAIWLLMIARTNRLIVQQLQHARWVQVTPTIKGTGSAVTPAFRVTTLFWRIRAHASSPDGDATKEMTYFIDDFSGPRATTLQTDGEAIDSYIESQPNGKIRRIDVRIPPQAQQPGSPVTSGGATVSRFPLSTHHLTITAPTTVRWEINIEEAR